MNIAEAIAQIIERRALTRDEMYEVITAIMTGQCTEAQIGGFLVGMRMKGDTVDEITGATLAMRALATPVHVEAAHLVDTCGTGGSGKKPFNVSTAAAFVAAAAGAHVAKHGNRAMSSRSGSADLLEAAGVNIDLDPEQVARCITEVGIGFMFAPSHHAAMRHAAGPRRELGVRTLFNLVAPMTNPAGAKRQLLGAYDRAVQRTMAEVLKELGSEHVLVVHSAEGLDEMSIAGRTHVVELKGGRIEEYDVRPQEFGLEAHPLEGLIATSCEESLAKVLEALTDVQSAAGAMVALNAGAAIYASDVCATLGQGVHMAQDAIASGLAKERLDELVRISSLMGEA
ncbi:MAG: anthranilate phosphoribosyltransferase [Gammaproteobacteria bacterium]|jgi:anthranilate phosphoribosyltransferase